MFILWLKHALLSSNPFLGFPLSTKSISSLSVPLLQPPSTWPFHLENFLPKSPSLSIFTTPPYLPPPHFFLAPTIPELRHYPNSAGTAEAETTISMPEPPPLPPPQTKPKPPPPQPLTPPPQPPRRFHDRCRCHRSARLNPINHVVKSNLMTCFA